MIRPTKLQKLQKNGPKIPWGLKLEAFTVHNSNKFMLLWISLDWVQFQSVAGTSSDKIPKLYQTNPGLKHPLGLFGETGLVLLSHEVQ